MRRTALLSLIVAVLVGVPLSARADPLTPSGMQLSSPAEASSGQQFWVRSITPCPAASDPRMHRFVEAWVNPQAGVLRVDLVEVDGDVDSNGNWEVTLVAPNGPTAGATASFYVRAACLEDDPWAAAPLDEDTGIKPVAVAYYEVNMLRVTSSGFGGAQAPPATFIPDPGQFAIVTTTVPPRDTTTTTEATTTTTAGATTTTAGAGPGSIDEAKARIAATRKELEARGVDTAQMSDVQLLQASPVSSTTAPEGDGGIPWWSFALASVLAVGAVVAWGTKRGGRSVL